jgi:hypothetical protein
LVKTQEELKSARNKFTLMREEVEVQRRKVDAREQEAFAAQYQLVSLQEEIESLRQQKRIIEDERDALKTSLKEEEVARIAAEGRIALPVSMEGEEFASPKKRRVSKAESFKENIDPEAANEHAELMAARDELRLERRLRQRMDDQIHFMKMECQFRCCSCRVAERQGVEFLHDGVPTTAAVPQASTVEADSNHYLLAVDGDSDPFVDPVATPAHMHDASPALDDTESLIKFSPTTGTFYKTPSPPKQHHDARTQQRPYGPVASPPLSPPPQQQEDILTASPGTQPQQARRTLSQSPPPPLTPRLSSTIPNLHPISTPFPRPLPLTHTIKTTTITIPLATTPAPAPAPAPLSTPLGAYPTMTREEALEQIRARRGRARSIASHQGTPRRVLVPGVERRDISAPAGRS